MKIYFSLPGFYNRYKVNKLFIEYKLKHKDSIKPGFEIDTVYGSFPNTIWNGATNYIDTLIYDDIDGCLRKYVENLGVRCRYIYSNKLINDPKYLKDRLCNITMEKASRYGVVDVEVEYKSLLDEYLREVYPESLHIADIVLDDISVIPDIYDDPMIRLIRVSSDLNNTDKLLEIDKKHRNKIEITLNPYCCSNCGARSACIRGDNASQLLFMRRINKQCGYYDTNFARMMNNPLFISNEKLNEYIKEGYTHYRIDMSMSESKYSVLDSYLYYIVKENSRDVARLEILEDL